MANTLVVRATDGRVIAEPQVGSLAVLWRPRQGTLRGMQDTCLQQWICSELETIAEAGGDQSAFLDQRVSVADEYSY